MAKHIDNKNTASVNDFTLVAEASCLEGQWPQELTTSVGNGKP